MKTERQLYLGLLLTRISIGVPMLFYGVNKVTHGITFIKEMLADVGMPKLAANGVYIGEILAPILMIFGIRTRLAGAVFFVFCLTIVLLSQTDKILKLNESGGLSIKLLAIYLLLSLSLLFTGAGKYVLSSKNKWD